MIPALLSRLTPVARTVAWPALLAGTLACVAVIAAASLAPSWSPLGRWPGLGALALCAGAAFLLDDAASATVSATPRSLARRRAQLIALALPLLFAVWTACLWYATGTRGASFGPDTRLALSVQFAAMLTLTLAASAIALRIMSDEHGGWSGALAPLAILAAAIMLPERWALLALPGDTGWTAAQQRWYALLAIGVLGLAWASRDPANRAVNLVLRAKVEHDLELRYSPERIAGRLRREFADDAEMWASSSARPATRCCCTDPTATQPSRSATPSPRSSKRCPSSCEPPSSGTKPPRCATGERQRRRRHQDSA